MKSENKEIAAKKLDEDMDAYWEKKGQAEASEEGGEEAVTAEGEEGAKAEE